MQTSLLLGAGFSVNQNYPTANKLNNEISNLPSDSFFIASEGTVFVLEDGEVEPDGYSPYTKNRDFFLILLDK